MGSLTHGADSWHVDFDAEEAGGPWVVESRRFAKEGTCGDDESSSGGQFAPGCVSFDVGNRRGCDGIIS